MIFAFKGILLQYEEFNNRFRIIKRYIKNYYYDKEWGLYYLRARYYDPSTARFISEDTYEGDITNPLSLNLYTYCANNPLIYVDPSGHEAIRSVDESGLITWEFTNLNFSAFESGKFKSRRISRRTGLKEFTSFHKVLVDAAKGKRQRVIDDKGKYYYSIEELITLDKEYGRKKAWVIARTSLNVTADGAATISGAKAYVQGAKQGGYFIINVGKGLINLLKPGKDVTGINLTVSQIENTTENKSMRDKIFGFFKNWIPFKGSYDGITKLTSDSPWVTIESVK